MRIAVIGGGITGLGAAWALSQRHEVIIYEAGETLGGHANTVTIEAKQGPLPVDTGFIVYNEPNYPNLVRLFERFEVPTQASDMSFAVSIGSGKREYAGSAAGLFAQPSLLLSPDHWRMIRDIVRFSRDGYRFLENGEAAGITLGALLARHGYSQPFLRDYLLPMAAAIWSSTLDKILEFPAETLLQFYRNHGLMNLQERPQWRTVAGGSREYVRRLAAPLRRQIRLNSPVAAIRRRPDQITVIDKNGYEDRFDQIVLATHADQALGILGNQASPAERDVLGRFTYQDNLAVLHHDTRLMPRRRRSWASWNYLSAKESDGSQRVALTYWMNRLQTLPSDETVLVTLNPVAAPAEDLTRGTYAYSHPQFDRDALEAQKDLPGIQGLDGIWFCGSYCGYGFHEDGLQAGLGVAAALGAPAPWAAQITAISPSLDSVTPQRPLLAAE